MGSVALEIQENEVTIVINNPEKMNCFDMKMLQDFNQLIQEIKSNKSLRVVKIQGAGDNAFSTGANLNGFKNLDHDGLASWIKLGNKLFNDVESLPIPTLSSTDMY